MTFIEEINQGLKAQLEKVCAQCVVCAWSTIAPSLLPCFPLTLCCLQQDKELEASRQELSLTRQLVSELEKKVAHKEDEVVRARHAAASSTQPAHVVLAKVRQRFVFLCF